MPLYFFRQSPSMLFRVLLAAAFARISFSAEASITDCAISFIFNRTILSVDSSKIFEVKEGNTVKFSAPCSESWVKTYAPFGPTEGLRRLALIDATGISGDLTKNDTAITVTAEGGCFTTEQKCFKRTPPGVCTPASLAAFTATFTGEQREVLAFDHFEKIGPKDVAVQFLPLFRASHIVPPSADSISIRQTGLSNFSVEVVFSKEQADELKRDATWADILGQQFLKGSRFRFQDPLPDSAGLELSKAALGVVKDGYAVLKECRLRTAEPYGVEPRCSNDDYTCRAHR